MFHCVSSTQAETRAEFAERSVAKLEKTIDDLEGMNLFHLIFTTCKEMLVTIQEVCTKKRDFLESLILILLRHSHKRRVIY